MIARCLLLACLAACGTSSSSDSATHGGSGSANDVTSAGGSGAPNGGGATGTVKLSLKAK